MKKFYASSIAVLFPLLVFAQITFQTTTSNVTCHGGGNGYITALAAGGVAPYSYIWSNGMTTPSISNLTAGLYIVTATDSDGLTASKSIVISQPPALGATLNGQPQICALVPDGFSYAIPTGGTPPYSFNWSNGAQTQLNNHLSAGAYTITVTDVKGCTTTGAFTVGDLGLGLYLFADSEDAVCPVGGNGSASVVVASGTGPYQYNWNTGSSTDSAASLYAGTYTVSVTDANGCAATASVTVEMANADPNIVQLSTTQCAGETYSFQASEAYSNYNWTLNDPSDSIISGVGSREVSVKWGQPGAKQIVVAMVDSATLCTTGTAFQVNVHTCAVKTVEPGLNDVKISPNPFSDFIDIQGNGWNLSGSHIEIFNVHGLSVACYFPTNSTVRIDTQDLPPGIYFVKISNGEKNKTWIMMNY